MNRLCVLFLLLCSAPVLASGVYKWTDKHGRVHYGDKPVLNAEKIKDKPGTAAAAVPLDEEARRKREADCKQQRDQLEVYQSAARLVEKDNLGNEREYTADDKKRLIDLTQAKIRSLCGALPAPEAAAPPTPPADPAE